MVNCTAMAGGAVHLQGTNLGGQPIEAKITNTMISECHARVGGGAISSVNSSIRVENSQIVACTAGAPNQVTLNTTKRVLVTAGSGAAIALTAG